MSTYLKWLLEQEADLKAAAHAEDKRAEMLWCVIRELRDQDERLRRIEKNLSEREGDHK